ncbi:pantoate--beta-alanine ligase [Thermoleophilum album]|uniref:Pantothenate synthetase n=1 Tax=Thermoleophilum album TaxID=29539 RepID=A0A1H6FW99_THEAL|nr:pantoate--beta-alanine ligase [Thermoleophilum album]SEH14045.1 pantoate--beta-alanine ligase [Thermoleophilum album]
MQVVRSKAELREALRPRRTGTVGLVPTMGYFHDGHLALMRRARAECDTVVVSVFVNPIQFRPGEDLSSYPRDEQRDLALAQEVGIDLFFAPSADEMYLPAHCTEVRVRGGLTEVLCGAPERRGPEHFDGVTTVVAKLFNLVQPDRAYFGQKDAQQALVVQRMVRDLDFPVEIVVCPTARDRDGLALSSRNVYLTPEERVRATALPRALEAAAQAAREGVREASAIIATARRELERAGVAAEYLELRSAEDLRPLAEVNGPALLAVAARIGRARLIDNTIIGGAQG